MNQKKLEAANDPMDGETQHVVIQIDVRVPTLWYVEKLPRLLSAGGMDAMELYLGLPRQSINGIVCQRRAK